MFGKSSVVLMPGVSQHTVLGTLRCRPAVLLNIPTLFNLLYLVGATPLSGMHVYVTNNSTLPSHVQTSFTLICQEGLYGKCKLARADPVISNSVRSRLAYTTGMNEPIINVRYLVGSRAKCPIPRKRVKRL